MQREAVPHRRTDIEPKEEKHADESNASHPPLDGKQRPENARVIELPHPQPLLQQLWNRQQADKQNCQHPRRYPILLRNASLDCVAGDWQLRPVEAVLLVFTNHILSFGVRFNNSDSGILAEHDLIPFFCSG